MNCYIDHFTDIASLGACIICGKTKESIEIPEHDCHKSPMDGCDCDDPSKLAKAQKEMELLDNLGR